MFEALSVDAVGGKEGAMADRVKSDLLQIGLVLSA
jgi:hypothetical protein